MGVIKFVKFQAMMIRNIKLCVQYVISVQIFSTTNKQLRMNRFKRTIVLEKYSNLEIETK